METINKQSNKVKHRDWMTIYTNRADQGEEGRKQLTQDSFSKTTCGRHEYEN